jgi:hypothetical protein
VAFLLLTSATARAQGQGMTATPMAVDLKKVMMGSWAEYTMSSGPRSSKLRWSLVGREGESHTLEMAMEGGGGGALGPKMTVQMSLVSDPTTAAKPIKRLVMQMGTMDPMEMPLDLPNMPEQRFEKPDPKKLVGKEQLKVPAGTFSASHYRDKGAQGTVDMWVHDSVAPLGLVKIVLTPNPGEGGTGQPAGVTTIELVGRGKGAKSSITKPAKPFDPALLGMPGGGHGGPPPGPPAQKPPEPPAKK